MRVADNCTICNDPHDDTKDANYGIGNVVIIEYAYAAIPQHIREALGLEAGMSMYVQYQHMATINDGIAAGAQVQLGDVVGEFGDTGRSFGAHLHLEVRIGATGALGFGSANGSYDTHESAWHDLTVVDPNQIWDIPDTAPYIPLPIPPNTPLHPSSQYR